MNTSKKGWSKEKLCRDDLQKDGWTILFQSVRTRWKTYDFSFFDVVAVKPKTYYTDTKIPLTQQQWKFISVKNYANFKNLPQHQAEIKAFKDTYGLEGMEFELWCWSKARWVGRGKNKHWQEAQWVIKRIGEENGV